MKCLPSSASPVAARPGEPKLDSDSGSDDPADSGSEGCLLKPGVSSSKRSTTTWALGRSPGARAVSCAISSAASGGASSGTLQGYQV